MNSMSNLLITDEWNNLLINELRADYFQSLCAFIANERDNYTVYPSEENVFNAFKYTSLPEIRVVILGQDPYHGAGQAHGLAFSVPKGIKIPPSLMNIFKELKTDLEITYPSDGWLVPWTKQGVFLLNTTLTVRSGQAGSHQKKGWEQFTDAVIKLISDKTEHVVFMLWGNYARAKSTLIDSNKHLILSAPHPSPLSAYQGFFGCKHFSQANRYLIENAKLPIDWSLHTFFN